MLSLCVFADIFADERLTLQETLSSFDELSPESELLQLNVLESIANRELSKSNNDIRLTLGFETGAYKYALHDNVMEYRHNVILSLRKRLYDSGANKYLSLYEDNQVEYNKYLLSEGTDKLKLGIMNAFLNTRILSCFYDNSYFTCQDAGYGF